MIAKVEAREERGAGWAIFRSLPAGAWLGLGLTLAIILIMAARTEPTGEVIVLAAIGIVLLLIVAWLLAAEAARQELLRLATERQAQDFERLLEVRTRELSELSTHLQTLAEKEKSELARRLHDELGGLLTAAKMDLSWLQSRVLEQPLHITRLSQLGNVLDEAMDLKRRVVEELRPSLLDHFGLPTALRAHVEHVCRQADLQFEVTMVDEVETLPKESGIALFRVIQEGLTNVVRHAQARQVRLALTADSQRYLLMLTDDGCGMKLDDTRFRWSHGLTGMRHRVQALGGRFSIESSPAQGTTLRVELPR
ncbi:MAG TPA: sensor histidine kinase [Steroidobacteraceae bacterium]|jgi:signal transduction histidine kinase